MIKLIGRCIAAFCITLSIMAGIFCGLKMVTKWTAFVEENAVKEYIQQENNNNAFKELERYHHEVFKD